NYPMNLNNGTLYHMHIQYAKCLLHATGSSFLPSFLIKIQSIGITNDKISFMFWININISDY
ncbi:MAG TPA: hypothetical protein VK338_01390, partial [Candidatus Nitrosocosmicus sp.]|nr:hypothetical protein [Candidatus Nitrosocosmicus sp.]